MRKILHLLVSGTYSSSQYWSKEGLKKSFFLFQERQQHRHKHIHEQTGLVLADGRVQEPMPVEAYLSFRTVLRLVSLKAWDDHPLGLLSFPAPVPILENSPQNPSVFAYLLLDAGDEASLFAIYACSVYDRSSFQLLCAPPPFHTLALFPVR